jgi:hypothetical protein
MPVSDIQASMSYSSASLFAGLPLDLVPQVETVLDNQPSCVLVVAQGPVAVKIWRGVADGRGWAHIIATDDLGPRREAGDLRLAHAHGHRVGMGLDPDLRLGRAHVDAVAAPGGPGHGGSFLG